MPKKPRDLPQGDMNKWVNDALTFIEGPKLTSKSKILKAAVSKNCEREPIDHKKAAKKAKQKLKKEERKLLFELTELREQFHSIYFKEFEAKNELKDFKSSKKQDKKKGMVIEINIKKLKKTKSKIETNILELISSLKTVNPSFKFSYLPTKEEQQEYLQKENEQKLETNPKSSTQVSSFQIISSKVPHLRASTVPVSFNAPFGSPPLNSNLFAPPGFTALFPTNPNYFNNTLYNNTTIDKEISNNQNLPERIVTIRRVYLPDNEAQVTVTAKGNSPDEDKLLYTFVNGQLVPANKISSGSAKKKIRKANSPQNNLKLDTKFNTTNKKNLNTHSKIDQHSLEVDVSVKPRKHYKENNQASFCETSKKNKKILQNNVGYEIESLKNSEKTLPTSDVTVMQKSKKKLQVDNNDPTRPNDRKMNSQYENNGFTDKSIEPIQLNFGENDVLTLVKLNGSDNIKTTNTKKQQIEKKPTLINHQNCDTLNHDCNNHTQYKFSNNLEDLYPAIKNLTLNSSSNSYSKSDSPSIMEQLKQGVNVENLKLPPGISLTKVDPATSQTLRAKQNSIQKLSQQIIDTNQSNQLINQPPLHTAYKPTVYPSIEIAPRFVHHDSSDVIMIDTNRRNLYQQSQQYAQINGNATKNVSTTYHQTAEIAKNHEIQLTIKSKKKKKKKSKQNCSESCNSNIVTLKNPMFNSLAAVKAQPGFVHSVGTDDQPALITKNENGMFTIRNTALQDNFLARYPYAGPGGILIPTCATTPTPEYTGIPVDKSCDSRNTNYGYPLSMPFEESMKDHVCEPSRY